MQEKESSTCFRVCAEIPDSCRASCRASLPRVQHKSICIPVIFLNYNNFVNINDKNGVYYSGTKEKTMLMKFTIHTIYNKNYPCTRKSNINIPMRGLSDVL